jgi:hypothetical protein
MKNQSPEGVSIKKANSTNKILWKISLSEMMSFKLVSKGIKRRRCA